MKHRILDQCGSIGWDFDCTLIDNPESELMHQYILAHPEKKHFIVTFRSHGLQNTIWEELGDTDIYPNAPNKSHFVQILNLPDEMYEQYRAFQEKGPQHYPIEYYLRYVEWKGRTCAFNGIDILVDDDVKHTKSGCALYGVKFLDSNRFEA